MFLIRWNNELEGLGRSLIEMSFVCHSKAGEKIVHALNKHTQHSEARLAA
jgi:hypothetical protein